MSPLPIETDQWWYQECVIEHLSDGFRVFEDLERHCPIDTCATMDAAKRLAEQIKSKRKWEASYHILMRR